MLFAEVWQRYLSMQGTGYLLLTLYYLAFKVSVLPVFVFICLLFLIAFVEKLQQKPFPNPRQTPTKQLQATKPLTFMCLFNDSKYFSRSAKQKFPIQKPSLLIRSIACLPRSTLEFFIVVCTNLPNMDISLLDFDLLYLLFNFLFNFIFTAFCHLLALSTFANLGEK